MSQQITAKTNTYVLCEIFPNPTDYYRD